MIKRLFPVFLFLISSQLISAQQVSDSLSAMDTISAASVDVQDSALINVQDSINSILNIPNTRRDTMVVGAQAIFQDSNFLYQQHPYFQFIHPVNNPVSVKEWHGKEAVFYAIVCLLIFFALVRNSFTRYIQDFFKIFFRTTVRQRQIKEQLMQNPLPSLLLNIFFLLSSSLFIATALHYFGWAEQYDFWILAAYCFVGLVLIYSLKYLSLKVIGWVLQVSDIVDNYIFIVFTANKVIGISLLPFLIVVSLAMGYIRQAGVHLGITVVLALLAYRYFLSYISLHRQLNISFLHFIVYLCAFEIVPLLLINKLLFTYLS